MNWTVLILLKFAKIKPCKGSSTKNLHKIFRKLIFLTPDTHTYVCLSGGKKC